jgi:hypothetical protein
MGRSEIVIITIFSLALAAIGTALVTLGIIVLF